MMGFYENFLRGTISSSQYCLTWKIRTSILEQAPFKILHKTPLKMKLPK